MVLSTGADRASRSVKSVRANATCVSRKCDIRSNLYEELREAEKIRIEIEPC
jgi:hypothetical protein